MGFHENIESPGTRVHACLNILNTSTARDSDDQVGDAWARYVSRSGNLWFELLAFGEKDPF